MTFVGGPRLSCDRKVISLLKERTLGNSPARLRACLLEQHTDKRMDRTMAYLSVLRKLRVPGVEAGRRAEVPPMHPVPSVKWILAVYVREALSRLAETKARITSIFGDVLKMDSTKKAGFDLYFFKLYSCVFITWLQHACSLFSAQMTKKLAGEAAGSAAWVTNVGNEHGQVLITVLTACEGEGLAAMATGLMRRYRQAGQAPPSAMYVDRDCCSVRGKCKVIFGRLMSDNVLFISFFPP